MIINCGVCGKYLGNVLSGSKLRVGTKHICGVCFAKVTYKDKTRYNDCKVVSDLYKLLGIPI